MLKIFDRFKELFGRPSYPAPITEDSSLWDIASQHPHVFEWLERKYGIKADSADRTLSLRAFVEKFGLPPPQILFMEVQMASRMQAVRSLSAREAKRLIETRPETRVLDVREEWERKICRMPNSEPLTPEVLDGLLKQPDKAAPVLLYCHFGVRSLDAATFLADRGFPEIYVIRGGIEAWAIDVDPSLPRYEAAYC